MIAIGPGDRDTAAAPWPQGAPIEEEAPVRPRTALAALVATALLAAGCGGRDGGDTTRGAEPSASGSLAAGDFGDLKAVCGPGSPAGSPAQGVTATTINVGTFTDVGFTKNSEFVDAAKAFTSWCNEAGGVNGRKLVSNTRDAKLFEVRPRMLESCRDDFALVGGGAAFDALGVKDRLTCLLPDFNAQPVQPQNWGSDLQISQFPGTSYNQYGGFWTWLMDEAHPGSGDSVALVVGDSPVTQILGLRAQEGLKASGANITYYDKYAPIGAVDWTPYVQAMRSKDVKGLVFYGQYQSLAALENAMTAAGLNLDWIDANSNSYTSSFVSLLGPSVQTQHNYADLGGVYPLERAIDNPPTTQLQRIYHTYQLDGRLSFPAINAFATWLLFAKSAASCGDELTRKCVYEAARKEKAWTGGGLHAPLDLSLQDSPPTCFNVEKVTPQGWQPADFEPNEGAYRCGGSPQRYTGEYPKPLTLADVGKSLNDLK